MARINTNIPSLIAQHNLSRSNDDLATRLQRLSTGLCINRGADDPAGLIVSERLRSEIRGLGQAIANSERASSVIATTEGYLAEVTDLLNSIKGLIVEAANTGGVSKEEIEANQLQLDSGQPRRSGGGGLRCHMQGPLVINATNRQGMQLVLAEKRWTTRHAIVQLHEAAKAATA